MSAGRKYLSPKAWKEIFEAQGCKCCVPGCESDGPFEAEHSNPNFYKPGAPDSIMCVAHHKEKTRRDKRSIAKTKRLIVKASGMKKRSALAKPRPKTAQEIMGQ